jgi:hypothetical protein
MEAQTTKQETGDEQPEESQQEVWYIIDPEWYAQRNVGLAYTVRLRRCADCAESGFPPKGTTKRRSRKGAPDADLSWDVEMQSIGACCSAKAGYLTAETSILEAVFRLLLQNGNQPRSVQQLYEDIKESWAGREYLRNTNAVSLGRMLERQHSYGITEAADPDSSG